MNRISLFLLTVFVCLWSELALAEESFPLTLSAGEHAREDFVIEFTLPAQATERLAWELVDEQGEVLPTQPINGHPRQLLSVVPGLLPAGQTRHYVLRPNSPLPISASKPGSPRGPGLLDATGQLSLLHGGNAILTYHGAFRTPPAGIDAHYARSGHIHPLKTPSGRIVTAEFPADHAHQHAVFFAWVHTQFGGHEVDFWNQGKQLGTVRHARLTESQAGDVYAGFTSELEHVDLTTGQELVVLHESWNVRAFALNDLYLIDLESTQTAVQDSLQILEYHYGGFGWRGPSEWLPSKPPTAGGGCEFLTNDGVDRLKGNHSRPLWVSVTGKVDDQPCTVAIFGHPSNLRHPQPVRLHPDKPYFCFAPCVLGEFEISRDRPLQSRYRMVVHDGPARPQRYTQLVQDWESPIEFHWIDEAD